MGGLTAPPLLPNARLLPDEDHLPSVGDVAAQLALPTDNIEAVLGQTGMTVANIVRLNI